MEISNRKPLSTASQYHHAVAYGCASELLTVVVIRIPVEGSNGLHSSITTLSHTLLRDGTDCF